MNKSIKPVLAYKSKYSNKILSRFAVNCFVRLSSNLHTKADRGGVITM